MTRQTVHAKQSKADKRKGRQSRPLSVRGLCWLSVAGGRRTAPAEAVVHTHLDGMFVLPAADADDVSGAGGEGGAAEIIVLVLGLGRPVRREHVLEAGADGVAVLAVPAGGKGRGHAGDVDPEAAIAPGVTALGVEQRRPPGVTE